MPTANELNALAVTLEQQGAGLAQQRVVAGFDGFVDEMITVVGERQNLESFSPLGEISQFGQWVSNAAGRSSLKEVVVNKQEAGGCAVNLSDGLLGLGLSVDLFATLGNPIQAPFQAVVDRCRLVESWCSQPGRTLAFEFNDGKLMFSSVSQLGELSQQSIREFIAAGAYTASCQQAGLIAFTNWTLYPHMTDCWQEVQERVLSQCGQRPWIFIDLVDPRSRSRSDIAEMLEQLRHFQDHGRAVLGLNLNEANAVADHLGIAQVDEDGEAVAAQASAIRAQLQIEQVVVHAVRLAAVADASASAHAAGPYCAQPLRSVGAGDRFNAGYSAGLLLGLSPVERLLLGSASSGFFVRQARSASCADLADFCRAWASDSL